MPDAPWRGAGGQREQRSRLGSRASRASVPGAITAGIAISLPFEAGLNKYVTPELAMQMHYFFTRKFALCWPSE